MCEQWQPLAALDSQFRTNLEALRTRDADLARLIEHHVPACAYQFLLHSDRIQLGQSTSTGIATLPNPVTPPSAHDIVKKLAPAGQCTEPLMIAGLDQGWLWQAAFDLPCHTPHAPGHRPPLYFLSSTLERLRAVMHLHDWTQLLSDRRVQLFVGSDAVAQCYKQMLRTTHIPWAKMCVTVEPVLWQRPFVAGANTTQPTSVDALLQSAFHSAGGRLQQLSKQVDAMYAGTDVKALIRRLRGEKLRVMGITSYYTTFLKYSMRDWLDAFEAMGHETRLMIEDSDHEITNPIFFGEGVVDFKPDLILMIDHFRAEIPGLPKQIPCVMWVQDNLPSLFTPKAGAAQGPRDYCVGFGRLHLRDKFGYPEHRFMPAVVGVNESRFTTTALTPSDLNEYGCDLSFVSHASASSTSLLTEQITRADPMGRKLLLDVFEQMRTIYDAGQAITHASLIQRMIDSSMFRLRLQLDAPSQLSIFDFFNNRINNALFRHQALTWAADMGVNLHLWGRGWEQHPQFAKFAKGVADNHTQLCKIYQASKINLQLTPFGAVHQRLLDGLSAGGFFLIRHTPGDVVEPIYKRIYEWCIANHIHDNQHLREAATSEIQQDLQQIHSLLGVDPFELSNSFLDVLKLAHDGNYIRSAGSVWTEYNDISFNSADQLQQRVATYLNSAPLRSATASSMRRAVIDKLSYTSITNRLLDFIADDLQRNQVRQELAA